MLAESRFDSDCRERGGTATGQRRDFADRGVGVCCSGILVVQSVRRTSILTIDACFIHTQRPVSNCPVCLLFDPGEQGQVRPAAALHRERSEHTLMVRLDHLFRHHLERLVQQRTEVCTSAYGIVQTISLAVHVRSRLACSVVVDTPVDRSSCALTVRVNRMLLAISATGQIQPGLRPGDRRLSCYRAALSHLAQLERAQLESVLRAISQTFRANVDQVYPCCYTLTYIICYLPMPQFIVTITYCSSRC